MMMTKKEKKRVPELRFVGFEEEWERKVLGKRCLKIGDGLHGTPKYVDDSGIYFINGNNIVYDYPYIFPKCIIFAIKRYSYEFN